MLPSNLNVIISSNQHQILKDVNKLYPTIYILPNKVQEVDLLWIATFANGIKCVSDWFLNNTLLLEESYFV